MTTVAHNLRLSVRDRRILPPLGDMFESADIPGLRLHYVWRKSSDESEEKSDVWRLKSDKEKMELLQQQKKKDNVGNSNTSTNNTKNVEKKERQQNEALEGGEGSSDVAVVFITDQGQTSELVEPMMRELVQDYRSHGNQSTSTNGVNVHTIAYDRPGYGFSDTMTTPRHARNSVIELNQLLEHVTSQIQQQQQKQKRDNSKANDKVPIIFVANGYGTWIARLYYDHFPDRVKGLVLIDPWHELHHVKSVEWREAETANRDRIKTFSILNKFGLMEIALRMPSFYMTKHYLDAVSPPLPSNDADNKGNGNSSDDALQSIICTVPIERNREHSDNTEDQLRNMVSFNIRKRNHYMTHFSESAMGIMSAKQVVESKREEVIQQQYSLSNVPVTVIRSMDYDSGSIRYLYKSLEDSIMKSTIADDLLRTLTSEQGRRHYMELPRYNHHNVYRSRAVKQAIQQIISDRTRVPIPTLANEAGDNSKSTAADNKTE